MVCIAMPEQQSTDPKPVQVGVQSRPGAYDIQQSIWFGWYGKRFFPDQEVWCTQKFGFLKFNLREATTKKSINSRILLMIFTTVVREESLFLKRWSKFQILNLQTRYHLLLLQIQFIRFMTRRQAPTSSSKLDTRTTQPACCMPGGRWAAMLAAIWLAIAGEMPMFIMAAGLRPWNCGRPGGAECREWGSPRGCPGIDIGLIAGGSCGIFWTVKIIKFSHQKTTSVFIEQFFDCFRAFVYLSGLRHIVAFGVAKPLLEG